MGGPSAMHPGAWILWATCAGMVTFTTTNPFYLALVVAVSFFVYAAQRIPGPTARSFRVFAIAGLITMVVRTALVFLGTVDAGNVAFAALEGARLATLLIVFGTFNAVTDPFGVVRLAPRRFHEPALAAALALSIAPRTVAMVGRVREAQSLRGIPTSWRTLPALAVPVLETGMEEAVTLAESMDARGHGRGRRTRYRPARWTTAAVVVSVTSVVAAAVFVTAAWTQRGDLHPVDLAVGMARGAAGTPRGDRAARDPRLRPAAPGGRVTEALRVDAVSFRYPDAARPALVDVTLEIEEGTFALAVGPTGAGKSTFLRVANGLVPHFTGGAFTGRVFAAGRDTLAYPPRALADAVAFVPQDPGASFVLDRVEEELAYGMENLGVDPAHMRRRVEEMLDLLDIEPLRARSVRSISGGERQRVAIAAALAAGPRILVLDEPTSQLDPQGAEHVFAALQRLVHDQGMTVILAEHRLERVAGQVDLALGFDEGRVTAGDPAAVIRRLALGPPVARLGRLVGWDPVPLTVRDARRLAGALPERLRARGPTPGDTRVELRRLSARHGDAPALHDVDLTAGEGEIVAVMGRNGAGKTTLLRSIAGVHAPASGSVRVGGRTPRPGVDAALCPQEPESVLFSDTVADEVAVTLKARGIDDVRPETLLAELGVAELADRHPRDLSAGQRLLVATAAIAAGRAPVLLLDEPTRGLDPEAKERLARFLRSHAADGGTALFATHDVELAAAVATRVVMLAGGEVIADGDPAAVLGDSHVFAPQMTRAFGPGWLTPEQVAEALA